MLEEVNLRIHTVEGIPASKAGEWPGIISNHWKSSKKILNPIREEKIFEDIPLSIAGRKHFTPKNSEEGVYKPFLRTFQNRLPPEERIEGLKKFPDLKPTQNKFFYSKKHYDPRYGFELYPEKYQVRVSECAYKLGNNVMTLEKEMTKKKRIHSVKEMRNQLELVSQGDKCYKFPECDKDFYKTGGLIPGSTQVIHYKTTSKKSSNFYETIDPNVKTLDPNKIWKNKVKNEEFEFQKNYVQGLKQWDALNVKKPEKIVVKPVEKGKPNQNTKKK